MISWDLWIQSWGDKHAKRKRDREVINVFFQVDDGVMLVSFSTTEINSEEPAKKRRSVVLEDDDIRALRSMCDFFLEGKTNGNS